MYNVQVVNQNNCADPITSMQIVQISLMNGQQTPVNIGTLKSAIGAGEQSEITVGFVAGGAGSYKAEAFNWNHWIVPFATWEAYSEPDSVDFTII